MARAHTNNTNDLDPTTDYGPKRTPKGPKLQKIQNKEGIFAFVIGGIYKLSVTFQMNLAPFHNINNLWNFDFWAFCTKICVCKNVGIMSIFAFVIGVSKSYNCR